MNHSEAAAIVEYWRKEFGIKLDVITVLDHWASIESWLLYSLPEKEGEKKRVDSKT